MFPDLTTWNSNISNHNKNFIEMNTYMYYVCIHICIYCWSMINDRCVLWRSSYIRGTSIDMIYYRIILQYSDLFLFLFIYLTLVTLISQNTNPVFVRIATSQVIFLPTVGPLFLDLCPQSFIHSSERVDQSSGTPTSDWETPWMGGGRRNCLSSLAKSTESSFIHSRKMKLWET